MNKMTIAILSILAALTFSCDVSSEKKQAGDSEIVAGSSEKEKQVEEVDNVREISAPEIKVAEVQDKTPVEQERTEKPVLGNEDVGSKAEAGSALPVEEKIKESMEEVNKSEEAAQAENSAPEKETKETIKEKMQNPNEVSETPAIAGKPDHTAFNNLLGKHVSSKGVVSYIGFQGDAVALEKYLNDLSSNPPASDWSRKEKLAYWINAYNAYTIKLILDNYPVKSIQDIAGGKPWDKRWIELGGKTYSLNQIENDIIRPTFNEPRIHFAVNCAAKSCPPLSNKAFTADNLNSLLEKQTQAFIANPKFNKISANSAKVSKIFDWYGKDFGNLVDYLNKYAATKITAGTKVEYTEYDWSLNN